MPPLLNILLNTPWWVFVLFVVLLVFGVRAFRPRSISVWRSLVIPGVFIAWGAVSLIQQMTQSSSYLLADWLVGGVIGAQFGTRAGQKISGERLRLLLGLLVLAVGLRFAFNLVLTPDELFTVRPLEGGP